MNANKQEIYQLLMVGLLAGGLTACATSGDRSKLARADQPVSFAKAYHDPADYHGARVIWGGEIQSVTTNSNTGSELLMKQMPLYRAGKAPIYGAKSEGTFVAESCTRLDPNLFGPGDVLTLTGHIVGEGPAGPEVQMDSVEVWSLRREPALAEDPRYTDDYPFDVRDEPVNGWTYSYVPDKERNERLTENHSPALTVNP